MIKDTASPVIIKTNDLIDCIYAVSLDPSIYPKFAQDWQIALQQKSIDFSSLEPHMKQAEALLKRLDKATESINQPLHQSPNMVFQADKSSKPHSANDAAQNLIGEDGFLRLSPSSQREFKKLLDSVIDSHQPKLERLTATTQSDEHPIVLLISNISKLPIRKGSALIVCTSIFWPPGLNALLKSEFSLSKTELSIVKMLVEGKNSREISESRNRSWETVRTQIRKILSKAGVESQIDLTRLILGYIANAATSNNEIESKSHTLPYQIQTCESGEQVEYIDTGKTSLRKNGETILFLHGFEPGHSLTRSMLTELQYGRNRVIAPLRAGYGRTTGNRAIVDNIVTLLLSRQVTAKFKIVSFGSGFADSLQLAQAFTDKVLSIDAINPQTGPTLFTSRSRFPWLETLNTLPASSGFIAQAMKGLSASIGMAEFIRSGYDCSTLDKQIIENTSHLAEITWAWNHLSRSLDGVTTDLDDHDFDAISAANELKVPIRISIDTSNTALFDSIQQAFTSELIETKAPNKSGQIAGLP